MGRPGLLILALAALLVGAAPAGAAPGGDPDRDGVDNRNERRQGSNPRQRDSDRDGRADGREDADRDGLTNADEDATGNDPVDRDSDDDGVTDGREGAGTVSSFADGLLTIRLAGGGVARGGVDELTEVGCPSERSLERHQSSRAGAGHGSGRRKGGKRAPRLGRGASVEPEEDEDTGEDDLEPDEWDGDEDWGGEDEVTDEVEDEGSDDEQVDDISETDDDVDAPASGCPDASLRRGARVHGSELDGDGGDRFFVTVQLVR